MPERLASPNSLTGFDRARFGAIGLGVVVAAACALALGAPSTEQADRASKVPRDGTSLSPTVAARPPVAGTAARDGTSRSPAVVARTSDYEAGGFPATAFEYAKMVGTSAGRTAKNRP